MRRRAGPSDGSGVLTLPDVNGITCGGNLTISATGRGRQESRAGPLALRLFQVINHLQQGVEEFDRGFSFQPIRADPGFVAA